MIDRREFLKASVLTTAALATQAQTPRDSTKDPGTLFEIRFKGQFLYLRQTAPSKDPLKWPEAVCLKPQQGDPPPLHKGWIFIETKGVDIARGVPPGADDKVPGWIGWEIPQSNNPIQFPGAEVLPEDALAAAARLPVATADGGGRPVRRAAETCTRAWPKNPDDQSDWAVPCWIPDLKAISGKPVKSNWRDDSGWSVLLPPGGTFVGQKPTMRQDVVAAWLWDADTTTTIKAATDVVKYNSLFTKTDARVTIPQGTIFMRPVPVQIIILCAPEHAHAGPHNRERRDGGPYQQGDKIAHFKKFYRVVQDPPTYMPDMTYSHAYAKETDVQPGQYGDPVGQRDDDIFCPGSTDNKP